MFSYLITICVVLGLALGLTFRVYVLVPCAALVLAAATVLLSAGMTPFEIVLADLACLTSLELAYLIGAIWQPT
jgi:hypothetical protein